MKLKDILNDYINQKNISVREFSRRSELSNSYLSNIVNGSNDNPTLEAIAKIAKAMNLSKKELFDALDDDQIFMVSNNGCLNRIPLYSSISCGIGLFVDDNVEEFITVPDKFIKSGNEYFANTASGDSMIGKGINDGDILIFEKTNYLENGQIGSFCVDNNEAVCKIFRKLNNGIILLESANENYQPIVIDIMNDSCFRIIGKLIGVFSKR